VQSTATQAGRQTGSAKCNITSLIRVQHASLCTEQKENQVHLNRMWSIGGNRTVTETLDTTDGSWEKALPYGKKMSMLANFVKMIYELTDSGNHGFARS
jgi:hypothetical protein